MMENEEERSGTPVWRSWPFVVGYSLTALFIGFWFLMALSSPAAVEDCASNFCIFWRSKPNEIGDTFAGMFGSLAFVWIIVTVMVQGLELRAQRVEIKAARTAQEEQARALALQSKVLANQNIALQEERHDRAVESLIASIKQSVDDLKGPLMTWKLKNNANDDETDIATIAPFDSDLIDEARFLRIAGNLMNARLSLSLGSDWSTGSYNTQAEIVSMPIRVNIHHRLLGLLERVIDFTEECSAPMQLEITRLSIREFKKEYQKLLELDFLWRGDIDLKQYYDANE
jgi:hypothetical protein